MPASIIGWEGKDIGGVVVAEKPAIQILQRGVICKQARKVAPPCYPNGQVASKTFQCPFLFN